MQQVAPGYRCHRAGDRSRRPQQVVDQGVDRRFHVGPCTVRQSEADARAGLTLPSHHFTDLLELLCNALVGADDGVECVADLSGNPNL